MLILITSKYDWVKTDFWWLFFVDDGKWVLYIWNLGDKRISKDTFLTWLLYYGGFSVDFDNEYDNTSRMLDFDFDIDIDIDGSCLLLIEKWVLDISITEICVTNMIFEIKGDRILS